MKNFLFLLFASAVIGSVLEPKVVPGPAFELEEVIQGMESSLPLEDLSLWSLYCFYRHSLPNFNKYKGFEFRKAHYYHELLYQISQNFRNDYPIIVANNLAEYERNQSELKSNFESFPKWDLESGYDYLTFPKFLIKIVNEAKANERVKQSGQNQSIQKYWPLAVVAIGIVLFGIYFLIATIIFK
jgi:hypothetical protein